MIRIRMLKPRNALRVGKILDQDDGVAEMWIASRVAERVLPERMVPDPPAIDVQVGRPPKRSGHSRSRKRVHA